MVTVDVSGALRTPLRGRDNRLRTFFTSMSRGYLRQGRPCYRTGDASAAALWAAPGAWAMPLSQVIVEAAPSGLAFRSPAVH